MLSTVHCIGSSIVYAFAPPWTRNSPSLSCFSFPPRQSSLQQSISLPEKTQHEEERENAQAINLPQKMIWVDAGSDISESQKLLMSQLPAKMSKRCKALMRHIICLSDGDDDPSGMLGLWVRTMNPKRADWLEILREIKKLNHPLIFEVMEFALLQESFEANIRDYTKLIDGYAKQGRKQDAENALGALNRRGFSCDPVILTVLIHMYSKAGDFNRAQETFEELKLLGVPLDKRAYGSMIMAYIRAGMPEKGESLLKEMESQDTYARREVYKALLRAYSKMGHIEGAQRVFDSVQFAGVVPDVRFCALLLNAYVVGGHTNEARMVLENLRASGLSPSDKCVSLMLIAYEKENNLNKALGLLLELEKDGVEVGPETRSVLASWLGRLGLRDEVELVLGELGNLQAV
ncbi:pentatricopeptide repeat-containing protein At1g01970 [Amborella trichopoda]|uniref:PROP1-like PPR domain-containing protein n=1 Tax=Amborella trichopoda TaxID=13333 RepID=W1NDS4_AMBTC|nr:pentatricopeptide repeat-containing protein At1g01970 [Amborella trichopoda]ERM93494.1 hypothetical protein AMTR_s00004p00026400 [Amborella trichopoda]|eukprot:XP_006826257.1 pentatricopeptide repeat-containing protein At1g01970 [Amborella trichopoda]